MLFRFLILIHVCATFPLKCPKPAQWSTRARGFCPDPSKYFCLKNDLINGYSENCTVFDFLQPGRKNVLRGGLDADICSSERYQPWPIKFYTNISSNCIFLKSTCNEEGQVVYSNGNRNTDITCGCDYTRGYDFIVQPRKPCFCVPSEEDCSCHLKMCNDSSFVLTPDYDCINSKKNISSNQCKSMIYERMNRESNQSDIDDRVQKLYILTAETYRITAAILITSMSLVVIFLSYSSAKVLAHCYIERNFLSRPLTIYPIKPVEGNTILISCEINQKNISAIWKKDGNSLTSTDQRKFDINERKHTLEISNAELSDAGVYCIYFKGVKREIELKVEDYFLNSLTIYPTKPVEGNTISISCEIKQQNISAIWKKDGNSLTSTDQRKCDINERKHTLEITNAELSDAGVYCILFEGVKRQIELKVEDFFLNPLTIHPTKPVEGNTILISCEIKQKNISAIWEKDGNSLTSTDQRKYDINERKHTLEIINAELSDAGVYCIYFEGVKRNTELKVEDYFINSLTIYPSKPVEGNTISISCEIKQKNISAIWKKDGNSLTSTDQRKCDINERKHTLEITNAELSDAGVYCIYFEGVQMGAVLTLTKVNLELTC